MSDIFSPEALGAQLQRVKDLPPEQVEVGGVATSAGDVGVQGSASADIGKPGGWTFGAEGSWMRRAGGSIAGLFRWTGK